MRHLLILNPGSSSIKFSVFELAQKKLGRELLSGSISLAGQNTVLSYRLRRRKYKVNYQTGQNIKNWWKYIHDLFVEFDISYVGFRMVHGGEEFFDTTRVNASFLKNIKKYTKLAPIHNPVALELIRQAKATWPRAKMSVSFDTSWYKDLEPEAFLYSLPLKYYTEHKISAQYNT